MGNCMKGSRMLAQNEKDRQGRQVETIKGMRSVASSKLESFTAPSSDGGRKRKMVRFKLSEEDGVDDRDQGNGDSTRRNGVVRIRVLLTQKELNQILNNELKHSSVEQLLCAMKLRSRKVSQVASSNGGMNGSWRPALESIPEDH